MSDDNIIITLIIAAVFSLPAIISGMKKLRKRRQGLWEVRRCAWPYPEGYATYNPRSRTILDTGLTHSHAKAICKELNREE